MCVVCGCVVIPFILDLRFVDVPAGVTQDFLPSFYGACLVRKYPSSCDDTEIRTHVLTSEGFEVTN